MAQTYEEVIRIVLDSHAASSGMKVVAKQAGETTKALAAMTKQPWKITVKDSATAVLTNIIKLSKQLRASVITITVKVIDQATQALKSIGSAAAGVANTLGVVAASAAAIAATSMTAFGVSSFQAAARVGELDATLGALSKTNNVSLDTVNETVQSVRKMGIEYASAQELVAKFVQNQLDLTQATKLARVAQDAAVIGQMNSTDALNALLHGILTQQTDVLRTVGINIDAAAAQEKYAKSIKKSTDELTAQQKQQAMFNAVLEEGTKITGTYEAAMKEPGKVLRSFPRLFNDIAVAVGQNLLDAFGPIILATYDFVKALAAAVQEGGALSHIFTRMGDTLEGLMGPVTGVMTAMTDWLKSLTAEGVNNVLDSLERLAPILAPIIGILTTAGGATIANFLGPFGALIPKINPIVGAIAGLLVSIPQLRKTVLDLGRAFYTAFTSDAGAIGVVYDILIDTFGEEMAGRIQPILQKLMDFLKVVQEGGGWVAWFGKQWERVRTAIQPVLDFITKLVSTALPKLFELIQTHMPSVIKLLNTFKEGIKTLLGPLGDMVEAAGGGWEFIDRVLEKVMKKLQKYANIFVLATRFVVEHKDQIAKLIPYIDNMVFAFIALGKVLPILISVVKVLVKVGQTVGKVAGFLKALPATIAGISTALKGAATAAKAFSTAMLAMPIVRWIALAVALIGVLIRLYRTNEEFAAKVDAAWAWVVEAIGAAVAKIKEWADYFVRTWEEAGGELLPFLKELGRDLLTNLWNGLQEAWPIVWNWLSNDLPNAIREALSTLITNFLQWGVEMLTNLWQGLQEAWPQIWTWLTNDLPNAIGEAMVSLAQAFFQWGIDLIQGLFDGITEKMSNIGDWLKTHIYDPIVGGLKSLFRMESPSQVMADLGGDMMSGLIGGIERKLPELDGVINGIKGSLNSIGTAAQNAWSGVTSAAGQVGANFGAGGAANPTAESSEVESYIRQAASERGIDPNTAVSVAKSEGGLVPNTTGSFDTGKSFWPFQLHYGGEGYEDWGNVAGMGNTFTEQTGWQPGDPAAWKDATDYALDHVKKHGWGAWYGAAAQGITGMMGVSQTYDNGGFLPPGVSTVANLTGQPERVLAPGQGGNAINLNLGGVTINAPGGDAGSIRQALPQLAEELLSYITPRLELALENMV